jgi:two-component system, NarL family, sensor kinase
MGRRGAVWLAWGVLAAATTIVALTGLLHVKNQAGTAIWEPGLENTWALASGTLLIFCFPGAVIIFRRPANPVGWILVAIGLSSGLSGFLAEYGLYALVTDPGSVPAGTFALWLGGPLYGADFGLVVLLLVPISDRAGPFAEMAAGGVGHAGRHHCPDAAERAVPRPAWVRLPAT